MNKYLEKIAGVKSLVRGAKDFYREYKGTAVGAGVGGAVGALVDGSTKYDVKIDKEHGAVEFPRSTTSRVLHGVMGGVAGAIGGGAIGFANHDLPNILNKSMSKMKPEDLEALRRAAHGARTGARTGATKAATKPAAKSATKLLSYNGKK